MILTSIFSGVLLRLLMEFHFNNGENHAYHRNERDTTADRKETYGEIATVISADITPVFSDEDMGFELIPLPQNQNSTGSLTPARPSNENESTLDLSEYHIYPRQMDKSDLIPVNNEPTSGVIRPDKSRTRIEETQRSNITIPIESINIEWLKRLWD